MIGFVAGFGRCGTSLACAMLAAGGLPVAGVAPVFEDHRFSPRRTDPAWRLAQTGRVVKWVCPLTTWCPDKAQGRVLWLDRNPEEQARSQVKLAVACGARWNDPGRMAQKIAAHITDHTTLAVALAGEQGPVERLAFEDLLADPLDAAKRLASFFRPLAVLDVTAAAGVVRPRTPDCRPDLEVDVGKLRLELFSHG